MKWVTFDFETSNSKINIEKKYTRVWAWDIYDRDCDKHWTGTDIEEFFDELFSRSSCILYAHNLKFDGAFVINYLMRHGFEIRDTKQSGTISTLITDKLVWYTFTVYYRGYQYIFRDSGKKIIGSLENAAKAFKLDSQKGTIDYTKHRDKGYVPSFQELEYIKNDTKMLSDILQYYYDNGMTGITNASDAMKAYKEIVSPTGYKHYFPVIDSEIDDFLRKSYKGGYCYLNPKHFNKDLKTVYTYDVKSMYPSVMCYEDLPYGIPRYYEGKYVYNKNTPLYIQQILVDCKLKEGRVPSIQTKTSLSIKLNYLKDTGGIKQELVLTSIDLERLLEDYEIYDIDYVQGYRFQSSNILFKDYVMHYYNLKETSEGALKQLYKIFLNSLYGKFAMMTRRRQSMPVVLNGVNKYHRTAFEEVDAVYTAVASFITANARKKLLDGIYANLENFVYCDTDSMHLLQPAQGVKLGKELGNWDLENGKYIDGIAKSDISEARYLGQKCYLLCSEKKGEYYEIKKIAGAPERVKEQIDFKNFRVNFVSDKDEFPKYRMMNVDGGVLLIPTSFTIANKIAV